MHRSGLPPQRLISGLKAVELAHNGPFDPFSRWSVGRTFQHSNLSIIFASQAALNNHFDAYRIQGLSDTLEPFDHPMKREETFPRLLAEFQPHAIKGDGDPSSIFQTTGTIVLDELAPRLACTFGHRDDSKSDDRSSVMMSETQI